MLSQTQECNIFLPLQGEGTLDRTLDSHSNIGHPTIHAPVVYNPGRRTSHVTFSYQKLHIWSGHL